MYYLAFLGGMMGASSAGFGCSAPWRLVAEPPLLCGRELFQRSARSRSLFWQVARARPLVWGLAGAHQGAGPVWRA